MSEHADTGPTPSGPSLRRGRRGLADALQRCVELLELQHHPDPDSVVVAAAEAVMWACALDELWRDARGRDLYWPVRDADADGAVLFGLRWARNNHLHELIDVTAWQYEEGRALDEFRVGGDQLAGWAVRWAPSSEVDARRTSPDKAPQGGRSAYDDQLVGSPVLDVLRAALRWFDRIAGDQGLIGRTAVPDSSSTSSSTGG